MKTDYCYKAIHFKPQLLCEERLGHFYVSQISRITQIFYSADLFRSSYTPTDYTDLHRFLFADGFIIILPFLLSLMTKLDGMVRTMVVAGEAGEAVVMM